MQEVINTAEDLVFAVKRDVKLLADKVHHIRNTEDIGLKTMAKLHGILMDCKARLQQVKRWEGQLMDIEIVRAEWTRFKGWLKDTWAKVDTIMEMDRVITVADCEAVEKQEPWYQPIKNRNSIVGGLLVLLATAMVIITISNLSYILA